MSEGGSVLFTPGLSRASYVSHTQRVTGRRTGTGKGRVPVGEGAGVRAAVRPPGAEKRAHYSA